MEWKQYGSGSAQRASASMAILKIADGGPLTALCHWSVEIPVSGGAEADENGARKAAIRYLRQMAREIIAATGEEGGEEPNMTAEDLLAAP